MKDEGQNIDEEIDNLKNDNRQIVEVGGTGFDVESLEPQLKIEETERKSLRYSILGKIAEDLLSFKILTYLSSEDLLALSVSCRRLDHLCQSPYLWTELCLKDFMLDDDTISTAANARATSTPAIYSITKVAYISKFRGRGERIEEAREAIASAEAEAKQQITISQIQRCLDFTQLRLLIPLPLTAAFLSILLLALYFDGYNISIWGCAAPLLFFVLYLLLSIAAVRFIYKKRYSGRVIFHNLWDDLRSPIKTMFAEVFDESSRLSAFSVVVILVCASQLVLIAIKLSPPEIISRQVIKHFNWGEVFAPMWFLFLFYCISPLIGCVQEPGIFLMGLGLLWVPFFILFVCLTVKLNGQDHHSKLGKMRMALIFMPFWIIEGFVLLSTLFTFVIAVHRRRRGLLERLDEAIGILISGWCIMGPFAVFQALICARDDGYTKRVSAAGAVAPLLFLLGWMLVCAVAFALKYRTPYQESRELRRREAAGTVVLFDV